MSAAARRHSVLTSPSLLSGPALFGLARLGHLPLLPSLLLAVAVWAVVILVSFRSRFGAGRRLVDALAAAGLEREGALPLVRSRGAGVFAVQLPAGFGRSQLSVRLDAVSHQLGTSVTSWEEQGRLFLRLQRGRVPERVEFGSFPRASSPMILPLPLGISADGPLHIDLARIHHLLVGGHTGAGKSAFLRQAIASLAGSRGPDQLRLALIDLKGGAELGLWRGLPQLWAEPATDLEGAGRLLEELGAEVERRMLALGQGAILEAPESAEGQVGPALPRLLLLVDELAELSPAEARTGEQRAGRQAALAVLARVARLGRGLGVHLILATQRPDADVIPGQIKANLPATLAFRVRSEVNSRILLGDSHVEAAELPPHPGRALFQFDELVPVQVPFLAPIEARRLALRLACPSVGAEGPGTRAASGSRSSSDDLTVWAGSRITGPSIAPVGRSGTDWTPADGPVP